MNNNGKDDKRERGFTPDEFLRISSWLTGANLTPQEPDLADLEQDPKAFMKASVVIRALRCLPPSAVSSLEKLQDDSSTFEVGLLVREALLTYSSILGRVSYALTEQAVALDELYLSFVAEQIRQVQEQLMEELKIAVQVEQDVAAKLEEEAETSVINIQATEGADECN